MDHSLGESQNYHRPTEEDLLDDYLNAADLLTVNEESRLKRKVQELLDKQDEITLMKLKHEREMDDMRKNLSVLKDSNNEILQLLKYPEKLVQVASE